MFERYTERARRVIFFARYEALQYGSQVISPEHILLGLMREDKTISARYFPYRKSLTVEAIRREVEERIVLRERIPQSAELHLAAETKRILAFANEESQFLKNRHIGPEHLLLGLVRQEHVCISALGGVAHPVAVADEGHSLPDEFREVGKRLWTDVRAAEQLCGIWSDNPR